MICFSPDQLSEIWIFLFTSGPPTKIVVSCKAFEKGGKNPETPFIRMYARSAIPYSIVCNIADSHGNHTPTKTSLTIEWSKASMGKCVVRGTQPNGEVTFPANSLRCNDIVEKARLKIHSQDVKSIQVKLCVGSLYIFCYDSEIPHFSKAGFLLANFFVRSDFFRWKEEHTPSQQHDLYDFL